VPIYEQSYRHYEGHMRRHFRWAVVVEQECRVLSKAKPFLVLLLGALLHIILRLLQVVSFDVVIHDSNNPLTPLLRQIQGLVVNEQMFFDFIRLQTPLMFLIFMYAGCGMICEDTRNNLLEVYFSKPIRWFDYALGKVFTLVLIGLLLTAVPATGLVMLHNALVPSVKLLQETWWWPVEITGFALVIIIPMTLSILASSALLSSMNFAAVALLMILIANSTMAGVLAAVLQERNYLVISFPVALNRIGQSLFHDTRLLFDLHWQWSFYYVLGVCLISGWIVFRRVRRAEVAA
jgi:ABC-type transport system involved in multi-copper enzyme maturation permease subunit